LEIKKIYGRDYPDLITKTAWLCDPQPLSFSARR
jgi:hypothetical protein